MGALWRHRFGLAGWLVVAVFGVMVARFWHPFYGMTRLLQFNAAAADLAIHEVREQPVFIYPDHGGYDGLYYAQIAYHPDLGSKELERALDNPGFRSRRILMSAVAWLAAGGREAWIADVFSWINIVAWLALAALLWRLLDVRDARGWLAWAGLLFSAGALHSVRQSLTDLPALLLVAGAMLLVERGRLRTGVGLIAAAALTRETAVLAAAGPASIDWRQPRAWTRNALIGLAVALPLALWLLYVRHRFGPGDAGTGNFTVPLLGWLRKWPEIAQAYEHPAFHWLVTTTLLATIGITAQVAFFLVYRRVTDAWWRIGAVHVVMALCLGRAVWEGHPGSFTRVLLPMSLAFAVCAVRWRVPVAWLALGALPVFAGVEPWRDVVVHTDDLSSGCVAGRGYFADLQAGFFPREVRRGHVRAWSSGQGTIELRFTAPPQAASVRVAMTVRGFDSRRLEVRDSAGPVWTGALDRDWQALEFDVRPDPDGRWLVFVASPEPPTREAEVPGARDLAFAVRDVHVDAVLPP
ncbi:MAG: hypothetical protein IAE82_03720 [Opitutaceae bacterium]|nr:hypothetical protein [Opitutaceae bacterium]